MTFDQACREAVAGKRMTRPGREGVLRRSTREEQEGPRKLHVFVFEAPDGSVRDFDASEADKLSRDWREATKDSEPDTSAATPDAKKAGRR